MRKTALLLLVPFFIAGCHNHDDDHDVYLAADLNMDGYGDVVIGAPLHDGNGGAGANRGAIFIHYGGAAGPSTTPSFTIYGQEDGAQFGYSLAFAGDVNGDGEPDLIVGAPFDDGDVSTTDEGTDRGRAFIFYCGALLDATPDIAMTAAEPGAWLGLSVARAGDVNYDGFDDWLVGAPYDDGDGDTTDDGTDRGRAFLYLGGWSPDGAEDMTFTGAEDNSWFGWAVGSAGDINAGGAWDIVVGAPGDDGDDTITDDGAERGRVFVMYGGDALDSVADLTMTGDEDDAQLGTSVAPVFDVNGDGRHDLLVGAPRHDGGGGAGANRGQAYVFFGGGTVDTVADLVLIGAEDGGRLGESVCRAGDINGDGYDDFLVGAPFEDPAAVADAGSAYLFLGGPAVDTVADVVFSGTEASATFGWVVGGYGDVDGAYRDVVIGAPLDDADGNATEDALDRGRVFVFSNAAGVVDAVPDYTFNGDQDAAESGTAVGK
ncbi:MAG: integrin alpha [Planctomycetota bacterium]|jgi:hypothetical protein